VTLELNGLQSIKRSQNPLARPVSTNRGQEEHAQPGEARAIRRLRRDPADPRGTNLITVGIADDEALMRTGVRSVLERAPDLKIVGEAASGRGAVELVRRHQPDVLVAVIQAVRRNAPGTHVIILAAPAADDVIFRVLGAGASGFLLKEDDPRELISAVRVVAAGDAILSPHFTRRLLNHFVVVDLERGEHARRMMDRLTQREQEVLGLLADGMTNAEIARTLYLSEGAVKAHVSRLLIKLKCGNRVQAAAIAYNARFILQRPARLPQSANQERARPARARPA
jgi:DNA-binding NarL/FixJ family response regulator